jgi:hypothetical protein
MRPYCVFEDGQPYYFLDDWPSVIAKLRDCCKGSNRYVIEMHNHFIGPFETAEELLDWLTQNGGAFDRAIVIHPTNVPPVFMITHLFAPYPGSSR